MCLLVTGMCFHTRYSALMHGTAQCVFRVQQSEEQLDSVRDEVVASRPVLESD